jgi:membrane protein DedA with SNARE-associated domain
MRYRTFTFFNALGGIVWATVVGMLGYLFGQNLPRLERFVRDTGWVLVVVVAAAGAVVWWWRKHRGREAAGARDQGAASKPPGP